MCMKRSDGYRVPHLNDTKRSSFFLSVAVGAATEPVIATTTFHFHINQICEKKWNMKRDEEEKKSYDILQFSLDDDMQCVIQCNMVQIVQKNGLQTANAFPLIS